MKNLSFVVALTVPLLVASAASAVDEHHPDQTPAVAVVPAAPKDTEKAVQQMGENVNKLRAQLDKIQKAKDPAERQKLVQEHMQTLRASMTTAAAAMGGHARTRRDDGRGHDGLSHDGIDGQHDGCRHDGRADDAAHAADGETHGHDADDA